MKSVISLMLWVWASSPLLAGNVVHEYEAAVIIGCVTEASYHSIAGRGRFTSPNGTDTTWSEDDMLVILPTVDSHPLLQENIRNCLHMAAVAAAAPCAAGVRFNIRGIVNNPPEHPIPGHADGSFVKMNTVLGCNINK